MTGSLTCQQLEKFGFVHDLHAQQSCMLKLAPGHRMPARANQQDGRVQADSPSDFAASVFDHLARGAPTEGFRLSGNDNLVPGQSRLGHADHSIVGLRIPMMDRAARFGNRAAHHSPRSKDAA